MRDQIEIFQKRFADLDSAQRRVLDAVPPDRLYWQPRETDALFPVNSVGEYVLRSAAAVESTFGGITAKLWDDPFEWTLPEALPTPEAVLVYLDEVAAVRDKGFAFFTDDRDLTKSIPAPEKLKPLSAILIDSLLRAEHFLGRAYGVLGTIPEVKIPRR